MPPTKGTEPMLAYHNEPQLKDCLIRTMRQHRELDRLIQRTYWSDGKGCAVGCLLKDPDGAHIRYEAEFGIPVQLAHLEDGLFEALPQEDAVLWPERFLAAIPVGADLSLIW